MRYALLDTNQARLNTLRSTLQKHGLEPDFCSDFSHFALSVDSFEVVVAVGEAQSLNASPAWLKHARDMRAAVVIVTGVDDAIAMLNLSYQGVCEIVTFGEGLAVLTAVLRRVQTQRQNERGLQRIAQRAFAIIKHARASGVLAINHGAHCGQVIFMQGRVVDAEAGMLRGADAAASLLAGLYGEVKLDWQVQSQSADAETEQAEVPLQALHYADGQPLAEPDKPLHEIAGPVRVLIADDDDDIRTLMAKMLDYAGMRVSTAVDGMDAFERIVVERPDVVVSDIMMPRLDGWGLLAKVRSDYRLRETPFALLSCHERYLEDLQRLDAGADLYLPKGVRRKQIVANIFGLAQARLELLVALSPGVSLRGRFERLGPISVLHVMAERAVSGTLHAEDTWARYTLHWGQGALAHAVAESKKGSLFSEQALRSFIGIRQGSWHFAAGELEADWTMQRSVSELVEAIALQATADEEQVHAHFVVDSQGFDFEPELLQFYARVCPPALVPIVDLIRQQVPPREVLARSTANPLLVDWLFKDMLAKGVVRFRELSS